MNQEGDTKDRLLPTALTRLVAAVASVLLFLATALFSLAGGDLRGAEAWVYALAGLTFVGVICAWLAHVWRQQRHARHSLVAEVVALVLNAAGLVWLLTLGLGKWVLIFGAIAFVLAAIIPPSGRGVPDD
jgi:hypothetical protein